MLLAVGAGRRGRRGGEGRGRSLGALASAFSVQAAAPASTVASSASWTSPSAAPPSSCPSPSPSPHCQPSACVTCSVAGPFAISISISISTGSTTAPTGSTTSRSRRQKRWAGQRGASCCSSRTACPRGRRPAHAQPMPPSEAGTPTAVGQGRTRSRVCARTIAISRPYWKPCEHNGRGDDGGGARNMRRAPGTGTRVSPQSAHRVDRALLAVGSIDKRHPLHLVRDHRHLGGGGARSRLRRDRRRRDRQRGGEHGGNCEGHG